MHKTFIFLITLTFCKHKFRFNVYKEYNLWLAYTSLNNLLLYIEIATEIRVRCGNWMALK